MGQKEFKVRAASCCPKGSRERKEESEGKVLKDSPSHPIPLSFSSSPFFLKTPPPFLFPFPLLLRIQPVLPREKPQTIQLNIPSAFVSRSGEGGGEGNNCPGGIAGGGGEGDGNQVSDEGGRRKKKTRRLVFLASSWLLLVLFLVGGSKKLCGVGLPVFFLRADFPPSVCCWMIERRVFFFCPLPPFLPALFLSPNNKAEKRWDGARTKKVDLPPAPSYSLSPTRKGSFFDFKTSISDPLLPRDL